MTMDASKNQQHERGTGRLHASRRELVERIMHAVSADGRG